MLPDVRAIERLIHGCFGCHHSAAVQAGIEDLQDSTHLYKDAVSRVFTIRAGTARMATEEDNAFRAGEALTGKVQNMVALTNAKLNAKTEMVPGDITRSKNVLYLLLAMGPLLSLVLATVFLRGFTTPVNRLLEATRSLKSGNLDHKVEGLDGEFAELASSFNDMSDSIKEQMLRMREAEQTLEKANQELKVAQEQMVRAETMAALGTLSSGISHELSTPLSVILNMTQLMKQEVKDDPALLKDMEVVEYEANQAIKVTRSLLGFARSTKSRKECVDVNRVLGDIFKILEFQPASKSVKLNKGLAPDLRPIHADSGQMRQLFLNIILNALQAMPDGGELDITTGRWISGSSEGVEITIRDTGTGIPGGPVFPAGGHPHSCPAPAGEEGRHPAVDGALHQDVFPGKNTGDPLHEGGALPPLPIRLARQRAGVEKSPGKTRHPEPGEGHRAGGPARGVPCPGGARRPTRRGDPGLPDGEAEGPGGVPPGVRRGRSEKTWRERLEGIRVPRAGPGELPADHAAIYAPGVRLSRRGLVQRRDATLVRQSGDRVRQYRPPSPRPFGGGIVASSR